MVLLFHPWPHSVKYKNYVSGQILVTSDVPRGDHLSLIFFVFLLMKFPMLLLILHFIIS